MILTDHRALWRQEFDRLKAVYTATLGELAVAIEHVGSTSIPGIKAKPILDIDIVIDSYDTFERVKELLERIGYRHSGDQGIRDREAFKRADELTPRTDPPRHWLNHHLYVCPVHSDELRRHMLFRDFLCINEGARREYEALKEAIAARAGNDRKVYAAIKEAECRPFFERVLTAAERWRAARMDNIRASR